MITNSTVEMLKETTDWEGNPSTTSLGTFNAYLEQHSERGQLKVDGDTFAVTTGNRGFLILFSDIDLSGDTKVKHNTKTYTVSNWNRYVHPTRGFHHIEVEYK